jgi:hypothetical protein
MIAPPLAGCARNLLPKANGRKQRLEFLDLRVLVAEIIAMLVVAGRRP